MGCAASIAPSSQRKQYQSPVAGSNRNSVVDQDDALTQQIDDCHRTQSTGCTTSEPSSTRRAIRHAIARLKCRVFGGVNGDVEQYASEVHASLVDVERPPSQNRIEEWLTHVAESVEMQVSTASPSDPHLLPTSKEEEEAPTPSPFRRLSDSLTYLNSDNLERLDMFQQKQQQQHAPLV